MQRLHQLASVLAIILIAIDYAQCDGNVEYCMLDNGNKGEVVPNYLVRTKNFCLIFPTIDFDIDFQCVKGKINTDGSNLIDSRAHAKIVKNGTQIENVEKMSEICCSLDKEKNSRANIITQQQQPVNTSTTSIMSTQPKEKCGIRNAEGFDRTIGSFTEKTAKYGKCLASYIYRLDDLIRYI